MHFMRFKDKQEAFDTLKSADNSELWSIATYIETLQKEIEDKDKKLIESSNDLSKMDKESMRARITQHLYQMSEEGNATASNYLTKLFNLDEKSSKVIINAINFTDLAQTDEDAHNLLKSLQGQGVFVRGTSGLQTCEDAGGGAREA